MQKERSIPVSQMVFTLLVRLLILHRFISFFTGFGDYDFAMHTSTACSLQPPSACSPAAPPAGSPGPSSPPTLDPQLHS